MAAGDKKIAKALRIARSGFFVGGKPGESAMAQAEANRNFGAGAPRAASDNGFRSSPVGGIGNAGMMTGSAGRDGGGGRGALGSQTVNTAAKGDFGFRGQEQSNLAAKSDRMGGPPAPTQPSVADRNMAQMQAAFSPTGFRGTPGSQIMGGVTPQSFAAQTANPTAFDDTMRQVRELIGGTSRPAASSVMPNLTGTSYSVASLPNDSLPITDFTTAANFYGASLPQPARNIGAMVGVTNPALARNPVGPLAQQPNVAAKGDFLGSPTISPTTRGVVPAVTATPASATFTNPITTIPSPPMAQLNNLLAELRAYNALSPEAQAAYPTAKREQLTNAARAFGEQFGAQMVSPGSSLAPTPPGWKADAQGNITASPGFRVVADRLSVPTPLGALVNTSVAVPQDMKTTVSRFDPAFLASLPRSTPPAQVAAAPASISQNPYDVSAAKTTTIAKTPVEYSGFGLPTFNEPTIGDLLRGIQPTTTRGIPMSDSGEFYASMPSSTEMAGGAPRNLVSEFLRDLPPRTGPLAQNQVVANALNIAQNPYDTNYTQVSNAAPPVVTDAELDAALNETVPADEVEAAPAATAPAPANVTPAASTSVPRANWPLVDVVPRTPIPPPPNANLFQTIANKMLPENLFPNALYTQPTPSGQWLNQPASNRGIFKGYMSVPYRVERGPIYGQPGVPEGFTPRIATTGMPDPNANTILFKEGGGMSFNPSTGRYEPISRFRGSLDERPGSDQRERAATRRSEDRQLIAKGYTREEIEAMSPQERREALGLSERSSQQEAASLSLPPLPEYVPYTLPTYNIPAPSQRVAEFTGQSGQPTATNNSIANALRLIG